MWIKGSRPENRVQILFSEQFLTDLDNIAGTHGDQDITRLAVFEQTGLNLVEGSRNNPHSRQERSLSLPAWMS